MAEYIEREAERKESVCRSCFHSYVCEQFNDHRNSDNQKCHFFNDYFVPAADVAPVVHSTWVWVTRTSQYGKQSGEWRCKQCRAIAHGGLSPYCSNCGAKMKLKEDSCDPT